jgi:hypothetical protein
MFAHHDEIAAINDTQAWRFAGLVQDRLTHPVGEKTIAVPANPSAEVPPWLVGCTGGVFTFVASNGTHIRTSCAVERACETWVDISQDGGKIWQRAATITKEDETIDIRVIASVERPYMYGKMVNGEPWVVLGVSVAERDTKCWDIREREAPLAHLEHLKEAPVCRALSGNAEYAYKDGVPVQAPDGKGVYFAATCHYISGHAEEGVNADTVFCKLSEKSRRYEIDGLLLPRATRGGIDSTCNRLTCELVLPDGSRFWGCDVRNVETENAALRSPLIPGDPRQWVLGDFNEITSFAVASWPAGALSPKAISVDAVLGRSPHPAHPALRWLGVTPLVSSSELGALVSARDPSKDDDVVILLTYERADEKGIKSLFQQSIPQKEMAAALSGKGPALLLSQDPLQAKGR